MAGQEVRTRILEGAYACVARSGLAKTTVEGAAREAGLSRATVYRHFPGGKDELLAGVVADAQLVAEQHAGDLGAQFLQAFGAARRQHHLGASLGKHLGEAGAESARCAGDHRDLAFEIKFDTHNFLLELFCLDVHGDEAAKITGKACY